MLLRIISFLIILISSYSFASDTEQSTSEASQIIHNKLYPQVVVPFNYYQNQKMGISSNTSQSEFQLEPRIPFHINGDYQLIVNPQFTTNYNRTNQQISNQTTPIQIATYLTNKTKDFIFGAGPYLQTPAANSNNGSMQTGIGVSYGLIYKPKHWVIGGTGYVEWGTGTNLSGGSANNFNVSPEITYITDSAWSYTINPKINYAFYQGSGKATNQILLTAAKTYKVFDVPIQFQAGPTYWVTSKPESPKGWGGYFGITGTYDLRF